VNWPALPAGIQEKQGTNGGNRPLVVHRRGGQEPERTTILRKIPKNPLFTTCGHYRQTKTRGQAGFAHFLFICQRLTLRSSIKIAVENLVDN
jgi:hypothetical protein